MRLLFLIFVLSNYLSIHAQNSLSLVFFEKYSLNADEFIGVDDFGYTYYLKNNALFKASMQDTLTYSNYSLGKITNVDVHNPFKVVVFYKDFNAALVLDSKLNAITDVVNFNQETRFNNAEFLSYSSENNLWVFADDNRLHLYNFQHKQDNIQSQPITFYKENFEAIGMVSSYKKVWVISQTDVVLFNEYGNYLETYPLTHPDYITPYQQGYLVLEKGTFIYKSNQGDISFQINIPKNIKSIYLNKSTLYIFDGKSIYAYKIK